MKDFTIKTYKNLLDHLQNKGFKFQTLSQFIEYPNPMSVILRHDVDKQPGQSLIFAEIQSDSGIKGTYYFRAVSKSWNEEIIKKIASLGHEIGYHYENMDTCNGNIDKAFEDFKNNLEKFRKVAEIKTICMHGSPCSRWDNRDLWKKYDYKTFGISGDPYYDIDFEKVFYLTDTGRCWDGFKKSIRDKIPDHQNRWVKNGLVFRSTFDIIHAAKKNLLPPQIMITFHPQRWSNNLYNWKKELILQKIKNQFKYLLLKTNE